MATVFAKFPHDRNTWNIVVVQSPCDIYVEEELTDTFTVEYETQEMFEEELDRFSGLVPFEIV